MSKESTNRPAPSSALEMFRRITEGHEISWPNAAASWRERLRNLANCGKVSHPGAWVCEALDCPEIPRAFRDELRRQVNDARAAARVAPASSPEPTALPASVQAMNSEAFPHFCDFLDALGGTPEEIDAARDRWMIRLKLASVRHGVAIPWEHFAPARVAFGLSPAPLPWERIVQGGQEGPGLPVAAFSAPEGGAGRAERRVA